jgi:hypothetical protein
LPSPQQQHANLLCSTTPDKASGRAALRFTGRSGNSMIECHQRSLSHNTLGLPASITSILLLQKSPVDLLQPLSPIIGSFPT